ncbi:MAG: hypothetical protein AABW90_00150 [Nanoarchaeota archaeon]
MKDLEKLIKRILDEAQKRGDPNREIIEYALKMFARSYKTCVNEKERNGEDKAAYHFIQTIFPEDLASQQIFVDFYDVHKKKIS